MKRAVLIMALLAILLGATLFWLGGDGEPMGGAPDAATATGAARETGAPSGAGSGAEEGGPDNSFIVCPGNPRCPK
jgi:tetrahydromethanopterin S-methyltransferase subunit D